MSNYCRDCEQLAERFPHSALLSTFSPNDQLRRANGVQFENPIFQQAFRSDNEHVNNVFSPASTTQLDRLRTLDESGAVPFVQEAAHIYRRGAPNCLAVGLANGIRGGVIGAAFGGVMGASTAVQSGFRGSAALTYAGQNAVRNAAAFASWTALYGASRCALIRLRRHDDVLNAAAAGGFTGAVLTLISVRGQWRYSQQLILTNSAGSALIAIIFSSLSSL